MAAVEVVLRRGRQLHWTTDRNWRVCDDAASKAARELAVFGSAPWNRPQLVANNQHVEPLYPRYGALAELLRDRVNLTFDRLENWTQRPEAAIAQYSGIATYRKTFELPADSPLVPSGLLGPVRIQRLDDSKVRLRSP